MMQLNSDYVEHRISLDELLNNQPSPTCFVRADSTYWKAGIFQAVPLVVYSTALVFDGSVVVYRLRGEMSLWQLQLHPRKHLVNIDGDGCCGYLTEDLGESDTVFGSLCMP